MPIDTREIIDLLRTLAKDENMRVTITQTAKAGFVGGGIMAAGAFLGGPIGILIGGAIGTCVAYAIVKDFQPAWEVIANMEPEKKRILAEKVIGIMKMIQVTDVAIFATMVAEDRNLRRQIMGELADYLTTELKMSVANH